MEIKSDLVANLVLAAMFKVYGVKSLEELATLLVNDEIFWFINRNLEEGTSLITTREAVDRLLPPRGK